MQNGLLINIIRQATTIKRQAFIDSLNNIPPADPVLTTVIANPLFVDNVV